VDFTVHDVEDYAALMASLLLPDPKMMDVAVPANMRQGLHWRCHTKRFYWSLLTSAPVLDLTIPRP
jgi:hypothetical protein